MRWYLDTEFLDDGRTIDLISIGLVSERRGDGLDDIVYYAKNADFDMVRIANDEWMQENVVARLEVAPIRGHWKKRSVIAEEILELVRAVDDRPAFYAYFADYDWVVFCQMYGPMMKIPKLYPHLCMDIKQEMKRLGIRGDEPTVPRMREGTEHNALCDAYHDRELHEFVLRIERECSLARMGALMSAASDVGKDIAAFDDGNNIDSDASYIKFINSVRHIDPTLDADDACRLWRVLDEDNVLDPKALRE